MDPTNNGSDQTYFFYNMANGLLSRQWKEEKVTAVARMTPTFAKGYVHGVTPLMTAAHKGELQCVVKLLEVDKVDPNLGDYTGGTALACAAAAGHSKVVETLLNHKAEATLIDNAGRTALQKAVRWGIYSQGAQREEYLAITKMLMEHHEDPHYGRGFDSAFSMVNTAKNLQKLDVQDFLNILQNSQ